jgi:3-hydroxymyristoyl/3-hydroxydecanoyl-(acyl carrier protein) dehydratase
VKHSTEIALNHPALEGHFPGNPIVPGVVLLDQVIAAFKKEQGRDINIHKIPWVKFLSPLEPGERIEFSFSISNNLADFTGKCADTTIVSGQFEFSFSS